MLEVLRRLSSAEFEFRGLVRPGSALEEALNELDVRTLPFERSGEPGDWQGPAERNATEVKHLLDAHFPQADLIHGNSLSTALFTGLAGRLCKIPCVGHVREIEGLNPTRARRLGKNTKLIAVSEAVRSHLARQGVRGEQIEVVHNGVDLHALNPDRVKGSIRDELGIAKTSPLIATIGQISPRKATDVFIATVCRLAHRYPDLHALVVGQRFSQKSESVDFETALRQTARDEGLPGRIHLVGWRDDVPAILRDLDLLVHAARQEPLGRVLLEACAMGIPSIATTVGGNPEIIDHGVTGWLVPPDHPGALAERIALALDNPQERAIAGREARRKAEKMFSGELSARRMAEVYRKVKTRRIENTEWGINEE
jgi:glycosyltransferase involved in cell wall biosynthesis